MVDLPPLLYDLTGLQRDANSRFGFTAERTLRAAQACYDQHKVITYPRTSSRFLTSDMIPQIQSVAGNIGRASQEYAAAAAYVAGLDVLPIGRVVSDAKVGDHHAIIPTDDRHDLSALRSDERRIYDLVARRFLAALHPESRSEATVVETEARDERFRARGKVLVVPGWRAVYGAVQEAEPSSSADEETAEGALPRLEQGEEVVCTGAETLAKQTKPPARYSDATLLRAMETAGRLVEDDELSEAMRESGLGTPATRAATIERLIEKEFVERSGKALVATDRGIGLIGALGDHTLATPALTGEWERRLSLIESGAENHDAFIRDIRSFVGETVEYFGDKDLGRDAGRTARGRALSALRRHDPRASALVLLLVLEVEIRPRLWLPVLEDRAAASPSRSTRQSISSRASLSQSRSRPRSRPAARRWGSARRPAVPDR